MRITNKNPVQKPTSTDIVFSKVSYMEFVIVSTIIIAIILMIRFIYQRVFE